MAGSIVAAEAVAGAKDLQDTADAPPRDHDLSDSEIATLGAEIDRNGYAVLPHYVRGADLENLRQFVRQTVAAAGNRYTMLSGPGPVAGTLLGQLADSPALRHVCKRLYEIATGRPAPDEPYYQILRCLTGSSGRQHSMVFHYDSYVLTVLLPIEVPAGADRGELIVLPNVRGIRRWYASNLVDKLLVDNAITQRFLRARAVSHWARFVRVPMVPGNLYFFWGYRSLHTNAPCDPDKIRATALFHFADPHSGSRLKKRLRG